MDAARPLAESEQIAMVRDSARSLLRAQWPAEKAVQLAADPAALRSLWSVAAQQGWTALTADDPELGLNAAVVIQQELGRAACPLPVMDAVLANTALTEGSSRLIEAFHSGQAIVTWIFGKGL